MIFSAFSESLYSGSTENRGNRKAPLIHSGRMPLITCVLGITSRPKKQKYSAISVQSSNEWLTSLQDSCCRCGQTFEQVSSTPVNRDCCWVLLDCRLPCSVLAPAALSLVANIADCCSLCQSPLTVGWITLLFMVDSRILPCRCNIFKPRTSIEDISVTLVYTCSSTNWLNPNNICWRERELTRLGQFERSFRCYSRYISTFNEHMRHIRHFR
jgi:hypothetical protein